MRAALLLSLLLPVAASAQTTPIPPGKAVVYFYRTDALPLPGPLIRVSVGPVEMQLQNGEYVTAVADPGFNVFGAQGAAASALPVDVKPDTEYFIRVTTRPGGAVEMTPVAPADARREMAGHLPAETTATPPPSPIAPTPPPVAVEPPPPPRPRKPPPPPYVWPGKYQLGFQPIGGQIRFDNASVGGYKLALDFAGIVRRLPRLTVWFGGGLGYTYGTYTNAAPTHDLQLSLFAMVTLEKLIKFPLVPFFRAGLAGDYLVYPRGGGGALGIKLGGGAYYFVHKRVGVGLEVDFTVAGGAYPASSGFFCGGGSVCGGFYGNFNIGVGTRIAL
jgi:hypothetical protein